MLIAALLCAAAVSANASSQTDKMKSCNVEAKAQQLKGAERKGFMKTCLSSAPAAAPASTLTPQQEKMKSCNADARSKALKGAERKGFMKTCLST
jgi:hypothetical protein